MTATALTFPKCPMPYHIEVSEIVAVTAELRVLRQVMAPGEFVPWHRHSRVMDRFFCLEGTAAVETRSPDTVHLLRPGDRCEVPALTMHQVSNPGPDRVQLLLVQGIGTYDFLPVSGVPDQAA